MIKICENIKQARLSANKSQREMADSLGVQRSTYSNWEHKTVPEIGIIQEIAKITGIPFEKIVGVKEKITKPTITTNEELTQTAIVKVLFQEVAKMKSKIYGLPFEDCLKELEQNTILVMKDLLKGTKTKT